MQIARTLNKELAELVAAAPARFAALAALPLHSSDAALAELEHALDELKLDGVILLSNDCGAYVGDARWEDVLAELDRRTAYVFVHPTTPLYEPPLAHPVWLYEFPFETTRVVTNLIYSGALERYREIRWQFPHLGGTIPFLSRRLASLAEREPESAASAPLGALTYLRRLHYDTGLSNHEISLRSALGLVELQQLVFGSDWPYAVLTDAAGDPAPELAFLRDAERAQLDARNVAALVPRLATALGVHSAGVDRSKCPGPGRVAGPRTGTPPASPR